MDIYLDLIKTKSINTEYLGTALYDAVNVNPEDDDIIVNVVHSDHENGLLPIDDLEAIINEIKESGATHIEIGFHEDHQEYEFNGFVIHRLTPDKEAEEKDRAKFEQLKAEQLKALKAEIARLENSTYDSLANLSDDDDLPF
jgi:hypothetical protein